MKGLFLVFHGFSPHSGITKKIFAQRDALRHAGADVRLCYTQITPDGRQRRMIDDQVVEEFGRGPAAKIAKRLRYKALTEYIRREGIEFLYVRHDHNANPALTRWYDRLRRLGVRILVEIPTWPYDAEFARSPFSRKLKLRIDRLFRRGMARRIDRFVTFSDAETIFGRPTLRISNGIDFQSVPLHRGGHDTSREVRLLGVANLHFWHGYDRVIEGLARYYASAPVRRVLFDIAGEGPAAAEYAGAVRRLGLEGIVRLCGPLSGEALDEAFDRADVGIASLGRHRNGIDRIKTLKNREYAARGIPFVYSETDDDFDTMPYVMKAPADNSPLDIAALLRFADGVTLPAEGIRATVEQTLSWDAQMARVVSHIQSVQTPER